MMKAIPLLTLLVATFAPPASAAIVVGGFDTDRAGAASIAGVYFEELRAAVTEAFPGATFVVGETLEPTFLSRVDVLLIGAPTFNTPISLSSAEQANLLNFLRAGGGAIIFGDNDSYAGPASDAAAETFLDPFQIDATGTINSAAVAKVSVPDHPVMNGPFGEVNAVSTYYPGWFDAVGPHAVALAHYEGSNRPGVLAIAPDVLGVGSGGVVLIADANALLDSEAGYFGLPDNHAMVLNAVKYVSTPEPSSAAMLALSTILLAVRRRRAA